MADSRYATERLVGLLVFFVIGGQVAMTSYVVVFVHDESEILPGHGLGSFSGGTYALAVLWSAITLGRVLGLARQVLARRAADADADADADATLTLTLMPLVSPMTARNWALASGWSQQQQQQQQRRTRGLRMCSLSGLGTLGAVLLLVASQHQRTPASLAGVEESE